ncbi:MAG: hypothetical protein K8W52_30405 [Deltaproteobacteria bacterium]|nr:hypothetical protein [Deltaproteobacteria bacterium]
MRPSTMTTLGLAGILLARSASAEGTHTAGLVRSPDGDFLDTGGVAGRPTVALPDDGSADGWDATAVMTGAAGREGDAMSGAGEAGADATAVTSGEERDLHGGFAGVAAAGASVRGRAGSDAPLGLATWAQVGYRWLPDAQGRGMGVFPVTFSHDGVIGALPGLGARRDGVRGAYAREQLGAEFVGFQGFWPGHRADYLRMGFGSAWSTSQDGVVHHQTGAHAEGGAICWLRAAPAPEACLRFFEMDMLGVEGGSSAAIGEFAPARVTGIPVGGGVYLDATGGGAFLGTMTISSSNQPTHTIVTEDLPEMAVGTYDLRLYRPRGPVAIEARARRAMYVSTEGDLSIEDRAELSLAMSGRRTTVTARGFAARTRWWTSKTDPGAMSDSGGGELALAHQRGAYTLGASAGVARSFYGALDGAAVGAPSLGARGTLELRRALR